MTYKEVAALAASTRIPTAYYQFNDDTAKAPPYLLFLFPNANDFVADNSNYQKIEHCIFELYTRQKDFAEEATVEGILTAAGLVYTRSESELTNEQLHLTAYEFDVVITG